MAYASAIFEELKDVMCQPPILPFPNTTKAVQVFSDAFKYALEAVFIQQDKKTKFVPVHYASRSWEKGEKPPSKMER